MMKRTVSSGVNPADRSRTTKALSALANSLLLQVLAALLLVVALKWPVLHDPPVWDTAMTVFPGAITLVDYDFDLFRLLRQPGYEDEGPNTHADSLVTLITAVIIKLTYDTAALLPSVHIFHFLITALTLIAAYHYGRPLLGEGVSLLTALALLMFPLFFAQAGYMYLEMPLLFATLMALLAWRNGKLYQAAFWATIAIWTKQTGVIVAGALCLAALAGPWPIKEKLYRVGVLALPTLSIAVTAWSIWNRVHNVDLAEASRSVGLGTFSCILPDLSRYLARAPDLAVFLLLFFVVSSLHFKQMWRGLTGYSKDLLSSAQAQTLALSTLLVTCFLGFFYAVFPVLAGGCGAQPRYYLVVLPFIFTTMSFGLLTLVKRTLTVFILLVLVAFFLVNREGVLYPADVDIEGPGNQPAVAERSFGYRQLASTQKEAMVFLAERIPVHVPIFFGQYEGYLNRYPLMGYVKAPMANAKSLRSFDEEKVKKFLEQPPDCVYFLYNYPWLGGRIIRYLLVKLRPTHDVKVVRRFRRGEYKIDLWRVKKPGVACHA